MTTRPDLPCSICGRLMWRHRQSAEKPRCMPCIKQAHVKSCLVCGIIFRNRRAKYFCSMECFNISRPLDLDGIARRRAEYRARKRTARVESVSPRLVYERDDWTCWICCEPIDSTLSGSDRWGPTMDHVMPLSLGGDHSYANIRSAHRHCNTTKGARYWPADELDEM